jgi:hypothetical protein
LTSPMLTVIWISRFTDSTVCSWATMRQSRESTVLLP